MIRSKWSRPGKELLEPWHLSMILNEHEASCFVLRNGKEANGVVERLRITLRLKVNAPVLFAPALNPFRDRVPVFDEMRFEPGAHELAGLQAEFILVGKVCFRHINDNGYEWLRHNECRRSAARRPNSQSRMSPSRSGDPSRRITEVDGLSG